MLWKQYEYNGSLASEALVYGELSRGHGCGMPRRICVTLRREIDASKESETKLIALGRRGRTIHCGMKKGIET